MSEYQFIQQPVRIGGLTLKNRISMSPIGTMYADENGFVTDKMVDYYARRAQGGVGLIATEHTGISVEGRGSQRMLMLSSDKYMPGMSRLTAAIHEGGAKHAVELNFAGRSVIPDQLTAADMRKIAEDWAAAAIRARSCGADGVIVHMANGYLLHRFLSPRINTRRDIYGGSAENRARFPKLVLESVRDAVGASYPVWVRMSMTEGLEGGLTPEDTAVTAAIMEGVGVDAFDFTAGAQDSVFRVHPTFYSPDGINMRDAAFLKSLVHVPVISGGKVRDLDAAEKAVAEGHCDVVSIGRPLVADPFLVKKTLEGRSEEVTPCLSCNICNKSSRAGCMHCTVNPSAGHEALIGAGRASETKNVLIIGGGAAGMMCALVCAEAGHKVTLAERGNRLGGHANNAKTPPCKERMGLFLDQLAERAAAAGAEVRLNTTVTAENVGDFAADAVVLAAGASPRIPNFAGIDTMKSLLTFEDVLKPCGADKIGSRVLILGGGEVGAEMADYLSVHGRSVTIVEMAPSIMADATAQVRHDLGERLKNEKVEVFTGTKVVSFDRGSVEVEDASGTRRLMEGYDNVVLAMGLVSNAPTLEPALRERVKKLLVIGDCSSPRGIAEAVEEAFLVPTQL